MRYLALGEVLELHRRIVGQTGGATTVRDLGALASAVAQPRVTVGGEDAYPTLAAKAAALCYSLIQNHPFGDGNKRVGHAAMETFLVLNGFELQADVEESEDLVLAVLRRDPLGGSSQSLPSDMTTPQPSSPSRASTKLLVASTLAWLAGILQVLVAFAVGWRPIALYGRLPLFILVEGVFGILLCIAGYMLRRRRKVGGVLATVALVASVIVHLVTGTLVSVGTGITLVVLFLVLATWGELH